jgi:hypothetical protein
LGKNKTIEKLYLDRVKIHSRYHTASVPGGVKWLSTALSTNTTLISLYLSSNELKLSGMNILSDGLMKNTSLTKLCLRNCSFSYGSGLIIANYLQNNNSLRILNLSTNYITKGMVSIAKSLIKNTTLDTLNMSENNLPTSAERLRKFTKYILKNKSLTNLDLSLNVNLGFNVDTLLPIFTSTTLKKLNLSSCNIKSSRYFTLGVDGDSIGKCFECLQKNTTLETLELAKVANTLFCMNFIYLTIILLLLLQVNNQVFKLLLFLVFTHKKVDLKP